MGTKLFALLVDDKASVEHLAEVLADAVIWVPALRVQKSAGVFSNG